MLHLRCASWFYLRSHRPQKLKCPWISQQIQSHWERVAFGVWKPFSNPSPVCLRQSLDTRGGHIKNPAYREVCTGRTGHAEVVQLTYDPSQVDLAMILRVFFATHDPTTLNRQGADVGTQYRSAIYIHSDRQRSIAEQAIEEAQSDWPNPIVTEVTDFDAFYPAEDYHQAYYELNKEAPYCHAVIAPKLAKFHKEFKAVIDLD